jgi:uncharacterized protein DUF1905
VDPEARGFRESAARTASGGATIRFPLDPAEAWGRRDRYHVAGTIDGVGFRTTLVQSSRWLAHRAGTTLEERLRARERKSVAVVVWPEGPQAGQLAPDITDAVAANPAAQPAFDGSRPFTGKAGCAGSTPPSVAPKSGLRGSPRWCDSSELAINSTHEPMWGAPVRSRRTRHSVDLRARLVGLRDARLSEQPN